MGSPERQRGTGEEVGQPGQPAAPVGSDDLSGAGAAVGAVAMARSGRRVDQLRVRVGGVRRACIPDCWPMHPHLVHEIAVVADQRRRAGHAPNSDILENWHRYVLPGFIDRMRRRLKQSCDDDHQPWPARSRHTRHISEAASERRLAAFETDLLALLRNEDVHPTRRQFTLLDGGDLIDPDTGEVL